MIIQKIGDLDPEISNIEFDSRRVTKGTLFFALNGIHTNGHNYIDKAISLGAVAICHTNDLQEYNPNIVYLKVEDTKIALSWLSASFNGFPSKQLKVIGVTGTDGKSTTVSLVDQLLGLLGKKSGYISTISFKSGEIEEKNVLRQSTPEASQINAILKDMINNGKEYAIVESTSHGLSHKTSRLRDIDFNVGILTNITQEHLEFHGTLEQYRNDKGNLFRQLASSTKENVFGVVNLDDPEASNFISYAKDKKCYTYSLVNPQADLYITDIELDSKGSSCTLNYMGTQHRVRLNLPGQFNIENLSGSLLAVHNLTNEPWDKIVQHIPELTSVKGRLNSIPTTGDFSIVVDYAHTPGSFEKVLPTIKKIIKGRLIVVFGSAGERDTVKRPLQGEIADKYANVIVLTDEDPRLEDSLTIINDIRKGIKNKVENENLFIIPDRRSAISKAIDIAQKDDMILTLGKGHETSMVFAHGSEPWNEAEIVKDILKEKNLY